MSEYSTSISSPNTLLCMQCVVKEHVADHQPAVPWLPYRCMRHKSTVLASLAGAKQSRLRLHADLDFAAATAARPPPATNFLIFAACTNVTLAFTISH
jgi:hypothetical protein